VAVTGRHGPAAARNRGWRAAEGEIVAFTDDDCVPHVHWLSAGVAAFADDSRGVGPYRHAPAPDPTDYELDASRRAGRVRHGQLLLPPPRAGGHRAA
jgi:cellulose synthase/poly-beta-1,6-N-acetylglucosamine synthase-like glycosyltransferase